MRELKGRFSLLRQLLYEVSELISSKDERLSPNLKMVLSSFASRKSTLSKEEFKSIRKKLVLTQEELAEILELSAVYISYLENGRRPITPEIEKAMRSLAKARGITTQELELKEAS